MSLRMRVFEYWITHNLDRELSYEEKKSIEEEYKQRKSKV
jgi:hypothetical protein